MASKKKLVTSGVALVTAAALALGGTFAWQSISQSALNEGSDVVNPGGRLHNDQYWVSAKENDTNIYVENFTENGEDIFARVRLSEYMEVVMNYGVTGAQVVETVAGAKYLIKDDGTVSTDADTENPTDKNTYSYKYLVHDFYKDADGKNATSDFFQWTEGKEGGDTVYYMPTFNKDKDSLLADLNGDYVNAVGGISNRVKDQYKNYTEITETSTATGWEVWDGDSNTAANVTDRDDLNDLIENGTGAANYETLKDHIKLVEVTEENPHTAKEVGETKGLMSMKDWKAEVEAHEADYVTEGKLNADGQAAMGGYWVYDEDGWVYWSSPIASGETTGLLLDGFELKGVMDDTWYYAINAEAQFVTANDVGKADGTGFYDKNASANIITSTVAATADDEGTGEVKLVSEAAETLLALIGVDMSTGGGQDSDDSNTAKTLTLGAAPKGTAGSVVQYVAADFNEGVTIISNSDSALTLSAMSDITYGSNGGKNSLTEGTDYSVEGNVYTFLSDGSIPTDGAMIEVLTEDGTKAGYICLDADDTVNLCVEGTVSDAAIVTLNTPISLVYSGSASNWSVAYYDCEATYWTGIDTTENNFTLGDGTVTINNSAFAGKMIALNYNNPSGKGNDCGVIYLIVLPTTDGETSPGGGQTPDGDAATAQYTLPLKAEDGNNVSFVSVGFGETIALSGISGSPKVEMYVHTSLEGISTVEWKELTKDTDYTLTDGVLTISENENMKGGAQIRVTNTEDSKMGYVIVDDDGQVTFDLDNTYEDGKAVDMLVVRKGSTYKINMPSVKIPAATVDVDYTYTDLGDNRNGELKWLTDTHAGQQIGLTAAEGSAYIAIYVAPAAEE